MQVSARILGQNYGLTAEEMNRVLVKLEYLKGTPGNYSLTEKAIPYAVEKDFHRGTGGYSCYNRYWTTRTFDDSIKEALDISAELIIEVRDEVKKDRTARYAAQTAARARANADFSAKQAVEKTAHKAAKQAVMEKEKLITKLKTTGKIGLITVEMLIIGYGVYKATPYIKKWWQERNLPKHKENDAA